MSQLVAALLGIVVGGLLTGGVQLYIADRERRMAARAAARLIWADHVRASNVLAAALQDDDWWPEHAEEVLGMDDWFRYRERLAGGISAPDFTLIDGAFTQVAILRSLRGAGAPFQAHRQRVERALKAVDEAGVRMVLTTHSRAERRQEVRERLDRGSAAD